MDREARAQNCAECEYIRMYDYGKRIYYCDHEGRIDDMGKISSCCKKKYVGGVICARYKNKAKRKK